MQRAVVNQSLMYDCLERSGSITKAWNAKAEGVASA